MNPVQSGYRLNCLKYNLHLCELTGKLRSAGRVANSRLGKSWKFEGGNWEEQDLGKEENTAGNNVIKSSLGLGTNWKNGGLQKFMVCEFS